MKKLLLMLAVVFTLGLSTAAMNAEAAKRIGSGKSMGTQKQATPDKAPGAPAQTATAGAGAAGAAGAAAAAPKRSWMGPLAGLAAGLGLAALASHLGFGDELASMLMFGLLAAAVMVAIGFIMRKRAAAKQQAASGAGAGGMQYAHARAGAETGTENRQDAPAPAFRTGLPAASGNAGGLGIGSGVGSGVGAGVAGASRIPADFDTASFERNAKVNFIRLQAANDAGNLDDIRQFTTPEMFAELKMEMADRGSASQKTDVVSINAQVMEVDEDADRYVVSVRFTGVIKTDIGEPDESFDEVWHLTKLRQGSTGWVLSGIQQMS